MEHPGAGRDEGPARDAELGKGRTGGRQGRAGEPQGPAGDQVGQLAANIQATDATITKAEADAKAQKEVVSMAQAEYDRAEAEWEAFVRQQAQKAQQAQGGSSDFTSDMFIWPLPGYSTITTYFGETQNING